MYVYTVICSNTVVNQLYTYETITHESITCTSTCTWIHVVKNIYTLCTITYLVVNAFIYDKILILVTHESKCNYVHSGVHNSDIISIVLGMENPCYRSRLKSGHTYCTLNNGKSTMKVEQRMKL